MTRHRALRRSARALSALALAVLVPTALVAADVDDLKPGRWTGGAGAGFLAETPDGDVEFALRGYADYFLMPRLSVGPLVQYGGANNDLLFGLSGQAKYWWDFLGSRNARLVVQGGAGFVRAGIKDSDSGVTDTYTSFLIPLGIGLDYTVTRQVAVTADFFLNFTSLGDDVRVSGREVDLHTNVMPALYLGVRF